MKRDIRYRESEFAFAFHVEHFFDGGNNSNWKSAIGKAAEVITTEVMTRTASENG